MKNVIVIFQAKRQDTESLALAFGLGAVQAGADIRLRHLDPSPAATLAHAGYGTLRAEDLRWAEGIAFFLESKDPAGLESLNSAFDAIAGDSGNNSKLVYLFHPDQDAASLRLLESMARQVGVARFQVHSEILAAEDLTRVGQKFVGDDAKEF